MLCGRNPWGYVCLVFVLWNWRHASLRGMAIQCLRTMSYSHITPEASITCDRRDLNWIWGSVIIAKKHVCAIWTNAGCARERDTILFCLLEKKGLKRRWILTSSPYNVRERRWITIFSFDITKFLIHGTFSCLDIILTTFFFHDNSDNFIKYFFLTSCRKEEERERPRYLKGVLELDGPGSGDRPRHVGPACPRVVWYRVDLDGAVGVHIQWWRELSQI